MQQASLNSLSLETMVSKPAWKTILLELIVSKSIDPCNIDIVEISTAFMKKVREMKSLDLLIPANVILAAAILLRYKSDYLRFDEAPNETSMEENPMPFLADEIPQLALTSRIPPKRQITLQELLGEMERIIKYENTERVVKHKNELEIVNVELHKVDMEKKMEEMLGIIKTSVDDENWALFSNIVKGKKKNEIIFCLISLLHLTQKNIIAIKQDKLWDEIFIQLPQT